MSRIAAFGRNTFASLKIRNYRLYFIGQGISQCGNWMQTVALGWLVLQLTGSGTQLGVVLAFSYFPMLVGGPFGGMIADRFDKRRLLYVTQSALGALALCLGILVFAGAVRLWMLYGLAFLIGVANSIDNPARQTFVHEMVGRERLRNAVTLASTEANLARVAGPLVAGVLIAGLGVAACFFINALSFVAVLAILGMMRAGELHREHPRGRHANRLAAVARYVAAAPLIRHVLVAMAVIGTLSYEFQVSLPLLAQATFAGSAADYAALLAAMGAGSVAGGLVAASRRELEAREFVLWTLLFGVSLVVAAIMPSLGLATVGMIFVGFFSINLTSTANTMLQLESAPEMRGRIMSLWSMTIFGSTLIGAPLIGWIGQYGSPRLALATGGIAAMGSGLYAAVKLLPREKMLSIPAWLDIRREETTSGNTKI